MRSTRAPARSNGPSIRNRRVPRATSSAATSSIAASPSTRAASTSNSPDAHLYALDAASGQLVWSADASPDRSRPYTLTAAPLLVKGKVIVGGGGGEYGVRGVVSAFDAETGKLAWRWWTIPGDPSKPFENEAMAKAAETWDKSFPYWENGGGGTVWNNMSADLGLNLIYLGTGNAGPWASAARNPSGKDNLYAASIVALDIDTGKYAWHYQTTPTDSWDYDADQDMILSRVEIGGQPRDVLMTANKNGFFYVLDRKTGKFLSAQNFVEQNWATGYGADGRPIPMAGVASLRQVRAARSRPLWRAQLALDVVQPQDGPRLHPRPACAVRHRRRPPLDEAGQQPARPAHSGLGWNTALAVASEPPRNKPFGRLIAWDPVQQKAAWTQEYISPWNGGTLVDCGRGPVPRHGRWPARRL